MLRVAQDYLARGLAVLPLKHRDKNPGNSVGEGWEALRLTANDLPRWFNGHPQNIGILLGEPSAGLVDIDLDSADAVALADHFLPKTEAEFGRAGKQRSHRLYRLTEPAPTKKWKHKTLGMVLEFRSSGAQTVFPPSTHEESGEPIEWANDGEPALIEPAELLAACQRLYEACCLKAGVQPKPERPASTPTKPVDSSTVPDAYARRALEGELRRIQEAPRPSPGVSGGRNDALNEAAFRLGGLVAAGLLDQVLCESQLAAVAAEVGLTPEEARKTISSGMAAGIKKPRDLSGVGTKRRESDGQNVRPNDSPEHDPSEAPCFDDDSGNYFLDKQRRGEAKHNSSVGSGFGNVDDEPADQAADAEPPFGPRPVGELLAAYPKLRPPVIDGLLRQGETANVIAAPKVGKSWAMLDMLFAVATGGKWLDRYQCEQGRALLVDNELHAETLSGRIRRLLVARQMDADQLGDWLHVDSLRGRLVDLYAMRKYFDRIEPGKYRLIVLDAFYRFLPKGTDENSNADVAALYNALDRYADRLGCAFALVHHSTKGSQSGKAITDVGAGAGSQSRATDTHIILRHHEEQGAVVFDAAVRSWAPVDPFCLRWQFPTWSLADDLDPAALRPERPPARKKKVDPEDNEFAEDKRPWDTHRFVAAFLGPEPILHADLIENAIAAGLSERLAKELLKRAEDQEKAFRWTFGRARPQKVATVKQPILKGIESEDGQS